ncbi:hypothetical protein FHS29_001570 [Saccharothrix tamanrassetensis]|uniref:Uncharacterized protein n=1 Tax=Saccharothrix tamanrassetensis TaxID=1051531 RepID=A0A841CDD7_9PSEU|nr:hypothetical protein [Saccharothrix tamanrassetensis]
MGSRAWLSCRLAAETPTASSRPVRLDTTWIFEPGLPRSAGFGLVRSPSFARTEAASRIPATSRPLLMR